MSRRFVCCCVPSECSCELGVEQFLEDADAKLRLLQPTLPAPPSVSLGAPSQRFVAAAPRGDSYLQQSSVMRLLLLEQRLQPRLLEILLDRFTEVEAAKNKGDERCAEVAVRSGCRRTGRGRAVRRAF